MTPYASCGDKDASKVFDNTTDIVTEACDVGSINSTALFYMEGDVHDVLDIGVGHMVFCVAPVGLK